MIVTVEHSRVASLDCRFRRSIRVTKNIPKTQLLVCSSRCYSATIRALQKTTPQASHKTPVQRKK
jgi:hypothetical protein